MRNNVARDIIRQRRARNMILPYMEHINMITKAQSQVRVFLAKKLTTLKREEEEIDQEIASIIIQRNFRLHLSKKRQKEAERITRFIRRIPRLRERRLARIRENLSRIRLQRAARRWIRQNNYIELPRFQTNLRQPAQERIKAYLHDRDVRRQARQHNWDVLNRRLQNIRRDIDDIVAPGRKKPSKHGTEFTNGISCSWSNRSTRIPINTTVLIA